MATREEYVLPPKPRMKRAQKAAIDNPYREKNAQRRTDHATGLLLPLPIEIEEGARFLKCNSADTIENRYAWAQLWNEVQKQTNLAWIRCSKCGVLKYGRKRNDPCGNCGEADWIVA